MFINFDLHRNGWMLIRIPWKRETPLQPRQKPSCAILKNAIQIVKKHVGGSSFGHAPPLFFCSMKLGWGIFCIISLTDQSKIAYLCVSSVVLSLFSIALIVWYAATDQTKSDVWKGKWQDYRTVQKSWATPLFLYISPTIWEMGAAFSEVEYSI